MNAHTQINPQIGTPAINRGNMYNPERKGWIAAIGEPECPSFVIGAGGMTPAGRSVKIVWDNNTTTEINEALARPWLERAAQAGLPIINDAPERFQAAKEAEAVENQLYQMQQEQARQAAAAWRAEHAAKVPDWAKAVIVAELHRDDCDTMTDYFATECEKTVVLAFSKHTRDLFPEMRKAARNHADTADLADAPKEAEHREKYSMGSGYYLSNAGAYRTGWRILKIALRDTDKIESVPVGIWSVPDAASAPAPQPAANTGAITIEQHTHTKKGFDMWIVILPGRVDRGVYDDLLATARAARGWYSRAWAGTPAGFAFKDPAAAQEFAAAASAHFSDDAPPDGPKGSPAMGDKLRKLADGMQSAIDHKFAGRRENTPKQRREAAEARNDAWHMKRAQSGLLALAAHHDAGTVPDQLRAVSTKKGAMELARARMEHNDRYYEPRRDTGQPYHDTAEALAFWELVQGPSETDAKAETIRREEADLKGSSIPGFFPTPRPLVEQMLDHAGDLAGRQILEPSAGSGAIVDAVRDHAPDADVTAYEISARLWELLEMKGHAAEHVDFLDVEASPRFDLALMNPPFEHGQDIQHTQHAFAMLRPGGRLVAIMSPSFQYSSRSTAVAFRDWLDRQVSEVHAIEAGAFKASGTGVATCLVVIDKDAHSHGARSGLDRCLLSGAASGGVLDVFQNSPGASPEQGQE